MQKLLLIILSLYSCKLFAHIDTVYLKTDSLTKFNVSLTNLTVLYAVTGYYNANGTDVKLSIIKTIEKHDYLTILPANVGSTFLNFSASKKPLEQAKYVFIESNLLHISVLNDSIIVLSKSQETIDTNRTLFYFDYSKNLQLLLKKFLDHDVKGLVNENRKEEIVFFYASWCAPCKTQLKELERLIGERPWIKIYIISYQSNFENIADEFEVEKFPKNISLVNGNNHFSQTMQVNGLPFMLLYIDNQLVLESIRDLKTIKMFLN